MGAMPPPLAVLTDIEGTAAPISFVHDVLFPFARERLPGLLQERSGDTEVADALAAVRLLAPGQEPIEALLGWMDTDAKVGPLKTLQGIAWRDGYHDGSLRGQLYADVGPALRAWHGAGVRLAVYSSGSVEAQRLIFGYTEEGSFDGLFTAFFDTAVGGKRDVQSYRVIADRLGIDARTILFLSDVESELDAAKEAAMATCQLARAQDGTVASDRHPVASNFNEVAERFGLPA